jgi:hypothetical protein
MKTASTFIPVIAVLTLLHATSSFAIDVKSTTAAGTACKADQGIKASATYQSLIIDFPELNMASFAGKRLGRANCNASINLTDQSGRRFRPVRLQLNTEVAKGNADELTLRFNSWFQGDKETTAAEARLTSGTSTLELAPEIWSPCTKDITLNAGVALVAKGKAPLSGDIKAVLKDGVKIELAWQPCSGK